MSPHKFFIIMVIVGACSDGTSLGKLEGDWNLEYVSWWETAAEPDGRPCQLAVSSGGGSATCIRTSESGATETIKLTFDISADKVTGRFEDTVKYERACKTECSLVIEGSANREEEREAKLVRGTLFEAAAGVWSGSFTRERKCRSECKDWCDWECEPSLRLYELGASVSGTAAHIEWFRDGWGDHVDIVGGDRALEVGDTVIIKDR